MSYSIGLSENSQKISNRINEIDVAKGIGIILVVFAHVNYTPFLLEYIYSFHMPLFFVLAGLVFDKDRYPSFADFLEKRSKNLICPYILFALASILFECVIDVYGNGFSSDTATIFFEGITGVILSRGSSDFFNAPLWFVLCLLVVETLYFFVSKLKTRYIVIVCAPLVVLGWFLESEYFMFENKMLPWSLDSALFALGFYALGNLMSDIFKNKVAVLSDSKNKCLICFVIIVLGVAAGIPLSMVNGKVSLGSKILNNGFVLYLTGIIGTLTVIGLSVLFNKSRFLIWCGKNSFYIMAVHYLCRVSLRYVYKFFDVPIYDRTSLKETILPFVTVFAISILFTYCYGKLKCFCVNRRSIK